MNREDAGGRSTERNSSEEAIFGLAEEHFPQIVNSLAGSRYSQGSGQLQHNVRCLTRLVDNKRLSLMRLPSKY